MSQTVAQFTAEEIDFLAVGVLSPKIIDKGEVTPLDQIDSPTYNYLMRKSKKSAGNPLLGGFRFMVKGNRGQKITWWDGADILPFESHQTVSKMDFFTGKGHLGNELLYSIIEQTGVKLDYRRGITEGGHEKRDVQSIVNLIEETSDDIRYNWIQELRKHVWLDNVAQQKCFGGVDALFPVTSNSTGVIGGRSRSDVNFRHQLITGVTPDTVQLSFHQMIRKCTRRAHGTKIDWVACGDYFYDILVSLFTGNSTTAGKIDYRVARDDALAYGEKYNIGIPQEAFMYQNVMIVCEPVFEELDNENSFATPFGHRCYFFNSKHMGLIPVMEDMVVPHGMPYNQRLQRTSYHGEMTMWSNLPGSQGVMTAA